MATRARCRIAAASLVASLALPSPALAQGGPPVLLPDIVVTATRTEQLASRTGTAISVITAEEIEKSSARSVDDLFRRVPGLALTQSGGPGQVQTVRIRGGDVRHTLVLIDGVRVNDPSTTGREFDFATLVLANVERIEVLRGPQSALYGSDAMGGVINIITKRGGGAPRATLSVEGGSFATKEIKGGVAGGNDRVDYAFGIAGLDTAGFSAFGYRIGRLRHLAPWGFEPDAAQRLGITGRVGLNVADGLRLEIGGSSNYNRAQYDAAFLPFPDTPSESVNRFDNGYARMIADTFGGTLRNTFTLFANRFDRVNRDVSFFELPPFPLSTLATDTRFIGTRSGAEYQGDLSLGSFGLVTLGARIEEEAAQGFSRDVLPLASATRRDFDASQTTRSLFALYQTTLGDRLSLSLGGRIDDVVDVARFNTFRATAAYDLRETGTVLRASAGTGGKAPSLFQLFSNFGTPTLEPETSFGADAGVDQFLFGGRVKLSATVFTNHYENLIDFNTDPAACRPGQFFGCYFNVAEARIDGLELAGDVVMVPELVRLVLTYTHLDAIDATTGFELARRPHHQGRIGLVLTPYPGLSIEPSVVLVGDRFDRPNEVGPLASYARFDLYSSYRLNDTFSLFARAENLTDAHYEEVLNYGTAGRSFYGGIRAVW